MFSKWVSFILSYSTDRVPPNVFTCIPTGEDSHTEQRAAFKRMKKVEKKGPSLEQLKSFARRSHISATGTKKEIESRINKFMAKMEREENERYENEEGYW